MKFKKKLTWVKLKKLTHLLELTKNKSTIRFVKPSIIYFSAKNKEVYIKTLRTNISLHFFKKKSTYHPDWQNRENSKLNKNECNKLIKYIIKLKN